MHAFYQEEYEQGFTTDLPDDATLMELLRTEFRGTEKDYSQYIAVLDALGCRAGQALLDYGCSWGYGSWQLMHAGYRVKAFEISGPRCAFARKRLGVDSSTTLDEADKGFDVVFSAHVLEHLPSIEHAIRFGLEALRPGGLWVAFTPNGSPDYRAVNPYGWHRSWGYVHPQLPDAEYYRHRFASDIFLIATIPYDLDRLKEWDGKSQMVLAQQGCELMVALRKPAMGQ